MGFVIATFVFQGALDPLQFRLGQMFDADEIVAGGIDGADQFVQLCLNGRAVAILRILDQEASQRAVAKTRGETSAVLRGL